MVNYARLAAYQPILGDGAVYRLAQHAEEADALETTWEMRVRIAINRAMDQIQKEMESGRPPSIKILNFLEKILIEHAMMTIDLGLSTAEESLEVMNPPPYKRFARRPPQVRIPRKAEDLRRFWDKVRRGDPEKMDDRAKSLFERTKKAWISKVQSVWEKYGKDWRSGVTGSKEKAIEALQAVTKSTQSRVKTIIETETTYYYNATREAFYSQSDAVSHYLFLAVRDHATTKWCKSRHGKVFEKGTDLFRENVPPCHWNCRSEVVPLTRFNPRHKMLIEDKAKRATRGNIVPLPPGWGSRPVKQSERPRRS